MKNIVIISCGQKKRKGKHKAKDLYYGMTFNKRFELIKSLKNIDEILILSGKYGLLKLDDEIEDYDQKLPLNYILTEREREMLKDSNVWLFTNNRYEKVLKKNNVCIERNLLNVFYNNAPNRFKKLGFMYQWINLNKNRSINDFYDISKLNFNLETKEERRKRNEN